MPALHHSAITARKSSIARHALSLLATTFTWTLAACWHLCPESNQSEPVLFQTDVKPLLERRCLQCHNGKMPAGDLDLTSRQSVFRPSPNGPFIVPGHPDHSKIIVMLRVRGIDQGAMPPKHRLSQMEIQRLERWIREGADWPVGESLRHSRDG